MCTSCFGYFDQLHQTPNGQHSATSSTSCLSFTLPRGVLYDATHSCLCLHVDALSPHLLLEMMPAPPPLLAVDLPFSIFFKILRFRSAVDRTTCRVVLLRTAFPPLYILSDVLPLLISHGHLLRATCPGVAFEPHGIVFSTLPTSMLLLELQTRRRSPAPPDFSCYGHYSIILLWYSCFLFALCISCILSCLHCCNSSVRATRRRSALGLLQVVLSTLSLLWTSRACILPRSSDSSLLCFAMLYDVYRVCRLALVLFSAGAHSVAIAVPVPVVIVIAIIGTIAIAILSITIALAAVALIAVPSYAFCLVSLSTIAAWTVRPSQSPLCSLTVLPSSLLHPFALLDSVAASVSPLIALFIRVCCFCLAVAFKYYCYTYRNLLPLRYCRVLRVVFKPSRFRGLSSGTSIYVLSVAIVFDSRYHRLG